MANDSNPMKSTPKEMSSGFESSSNAGPDSVRRISNSSHERDVFQHEQHEKDNFQHEQHERNDSGHEQHERNDSGHEQHERVDLKKVRADVKARVCNVFHELIDTPYPANVVWCGTLTDLVELTHVAWLSNTFFDSTGRCISFKNMLARVCKVLHCRQVRNPYSLVGRAREKKGIYGLSVIDRYVNLVVNGHIINPMRLDIRYV